MPMGTIILLQLELFVSPSILYRVIIDFPYQLLPVFLQYFEDFLQYLPISLGIVVAR